MQDQSCVLATSSQIVQSVFQKNKYICLCTVLRAAVSWNGRCYLFMCQRKLAAGGDLRSWTMTGLNDHTLKKDSIWIQTICEDEMGTRCDAGRGARLLSHYPLPLPESSKWAKIKWDHESLLANKTTLGNSATSPKCKYKDDIQNNEVMMEWDMMGLLPFDMKRRHRDSAVAAFGCALNCRWHCDGFTQQFGATHDNVEHEKKKKIKVKQWLHVWLIWMMTNDYHSPKQLRLTHCAPVSAWQSRY